MSLIKSVDLSKACVCDDDYFAHCCHERKPGRFACLDKFLVERSELIVAACSGESCDEQDGPQGSAPACGLAPEIGRSAVFWMRGECGERSRLSAGDVSKFRHEGDQTGRDDGGNAWDSFECGLAAGKDSVTGKERLDLPVKGNNLAGQERYQACNRVLGKVRARCLGAGAFDLAGLNEIDAAAHESSQLDMVFVLRRIPDKGSSTLNTIKRQHPGVDLVGLGPAERAGEGADLAAIAAMDRNAEAAKDGEQLILMAAGGFAHSKCTVAQRGKRGKEGVKIVVDRQGLIRLAVMERHGLLGYVEADDGLDLPVCLGHDDHPALDCLRARRKASHSSQQANEAGAAGALDEVGRKAHS
jgi:hypothetical protein